MLKQIKLALQQSLENAFPINIHTDPHSFKLYPMCNEREYWKVIENLENIHALRKLSHMRVAVLFGESNFLSMLPSLTKLVDVILLADIESKLHQHTQHLLNLFKQADSPEKFVTEYRHSNVMDNITLTGEPEPGLKHLTENFFSKDSNAFISLKKHFFLHSQERYNTCKEALDKLSVIQIKLNLADRTSCAQLNFLLQTHQANITFCNFSNIHHYANLIHLRLSTSALLKESNECIVMYAQGFRSDLNACFSIGLTDYFADCLGLPKNVNPGNAPISRNISHSLFFSQTKKNQPSVCYLALTADSSGTVSHTTIQSIIDQTHTTTINDLSIRLHAFDSYDAAKQFAITILTEEKINTQRENAYWIFTLQGAAHELNPLLRYFDFNHQLQHYPLDMKGDGREIEDRIIKVQNNTKTMTFEKSPGSLLKKRVLTHFQATEEAEDACCQMGCSIQ